MDNFQIPDNVTPEERRILEEYRKTGKIPTENSITVQCNTALCAETPILIGDEMSTARQVHFAHSGKSVKTFGLDARYNIVECEIIQIPEEIYIPSKVSIGLAYGFHFECSPTSLILTKENGYKEVQSLKKGDKVAIFMFDSSTGKFIFEETPITTYEYSPIIELKIPAYLFVSEFQNLLLPYYIPGSSGIAFVDVKQ